MSLPSTLGRSAKLITDQINQPEEFSHCLYLILFLIFIVMSTILIL